MTTGGIPTNNLKELRTVASDLNKETDTLNIALQEVQNQLSSLNLEIETWLKTPIAIKKVGFDLSRDKIIWYEFFLGYCRLKGQWTLAVKKVKVERVLSLTDERFEYKSPVPLLNVSRKMRIEALGSLQDLIKAIERKMKEAV